MGGQRTEKGEPMSIIHDAYLFKLEDFAVAAAPYLGALATSSADYRQLRADAIQLYDRTPQVQNLAAEYGGWDKASFLTFPVDHPEKPGDTFFWLFFILYSQFKSRPRDLGLFSNWKLLDATLLTLGWAEADRNLLIHGFSFSRFAEEWLGRNTALAERWSPGVADWTDFQPHSTLGQAGWLDRDTIDQRLVRLRNDQPKLTGVQGQLNSIADSE